MNTEIGSKIDIISQTKASFAVDGVDIPGVPSINFREQVEGIVRRSSDFPFTIEQRPLYPDYPALAILYENPVPTLAGKDVTSFHFPGASGRWDLNRCGPQFDGYAGAAIRGGIGRAIILSWKYSMHPGSNTNVYQQIQEVVDAIQKSGAKKVYLSGRSYGAHIVLRSIERVKDLGVEIVGVDLKVPVLNREEDNNPLAIKIGQTPIAIIRGEGDPVTSRQVSDSLYSIIKGPKLLSTLIDLNLNHSIGRHNPSTFNHHIDTPALKRATVALTEAFIRSVVR